MKLLGKYKNGNYKVMLLEDGTKIRFNNLDNLTPAFAESMDVKLTDKCSVGCIFCYENSSPNGKHSDIMNQAWIQSVHPYTELAINGNDMDHPKLEEFLKFMKEKKVIVSMTLNLKQFLKNIDKVDRYVNEKLIYGLGISIPGCFDGNADTDKIFDTIAKYDNAVLHLINGIISPEFITQYQDKLSKCKILILGYKNVGRGIAYRQNADEYVTRNIEWLKQNFIDMQKSGKFKLVSFDNLAIEQLELEKQIKEHPELGLNWENLYMGDDGDYSFYIDAVNKTFSLNSTVSKDIRYDINDMNVDEMFKYLNKHE
jgi:MoaA/NifB/PqqE/SkfB family radical SAM enzyme